MREAEREREKERWKLSWSRTGHRLTVIRAAHKGVRWRNKSRTQIVTDFR